MAQARSIIRARRRVAEVAAIFLGVALAFLAENWREDRQDQVAVEDLATALLEDLEATQEDLASIREYAREKTRTSLEAREHLRSPTPTISIDSLSQLLARGGATNVQSPVLRSYDQLVATGLLHRLEPGIREALAEWVSLMEKSRDYYERDVLVFRQNVGFSFWARSEVSFEQMLSGFLEGVDLGEPRFPHTWSALHSDPELNDVLVQFAILSAATEQSYERQEVALGRLIELLRAEYQ